MKQFLKWGIFTLILILAILAYVYRPVYPYKVGACVEDTRLHRIYEVTGSLDHFKTGEVPVIVRVTGAAINDLYKPGTRTSIERESEHHKVVECP